MSAAHPPPSSQTVSYVAYVDGSCSPNPGVGGWGALIELPDGTTKEIQGAVSSTTNNRMELTAAIEVLRYVPEGSSVEIVTDSRIVIRVAHRRRPRSSNHDLWVALVEGVKRHERVTWRWVRGHAGHRGNERADVLAKQARIKRTRRQLVPRFVVSRHESCTHVWANRDVPPWAAELGAFRTFTGAEKSSGLVCVPV